MKLIRWILGKLLLAWEEWFKPTPMVRSPEAQAKLDAATAPLAIYQFKACPFCVKVRREITRLNLKIELRDAQGDPKFREELLREGGQLQVPCLRIPQATGNPRWLYESDDIIQFLRALLEEQVRTLVAT